MSDSIEMRPALLHSPRVRQMAKSLKADEKFREWAKSAQETNDLLARAVVGTLLQVWATARSLAPTGHFTGGSMEEIDRIAGVPGFAQAMLDAGWLKFYDGGVCLPNFSEHNPTGAAKTEKKAGTPRPVPERDPMGFQQFWEAYPKKVGKGDARKEWARISPGVELIGEMLKALSLQKRSEAWLKEGGQFIPNPSTWLHQRRWEDEPGKVLPDPVERQRRARQAQQARREADPAPLAGEEVRRILAQARERQFQDLDQKRQQEGESA